MRRNVEMPEDLFMMLIAYYLGGDDAVSNMNEREHFERLNSRIRSDLRDAAARGTTEKERRAAMLQCLHTHGVCIDPYLHR